MSQSDDVCATPLEVQEAAGRFLATRWPRHSFMDATSFTPAGDNWLVVFSERMADPVSDRSVLQVWFNPQGEVISEERVGEDPSPPRLPAAVREAAERNLQEAKDLLAQDRRTLFDLAQVGYKLWAARVVYHPVYETDDPTPPVFEQLAAASFRVNAERLYQLGIDPVLSRRFDEIPKPLLADLVLTYLQEQGVSGLKDCTIWQVVEGELQPKMTTARAHRHDPVPLGASVVGRVAAGAHPWVVSSGLEHELFYMEQETARTAGWQALVAVPIWHPRSPCLVIGVLELYFSRALEIMEIESLLNTGIILASLIALKLAST